MSLGALQRCLDFNTREFKADLVHCHTWYVQWAGILAKLNYGIPMVITVHSLEPLRPWKREQLGGGYDFSCWVEKLPGGIADNAAAGNSSKLGETNRSTRFDRRNSDDFAVRQLATVPRRGVCLQLEFVARRKRDLATQTHAYAIQMRQRDMTYFAGHFRYQTVCGDSR